MTAMVTVIDGDDDVKGVKSNSQDQPKRPLKRKRPALACKLSSEPKESQIEAYRKEIEGLLRYHREMMLDKRLELELELGDGGSLNAMVAVLLQDRCDPYSRLTEEIFGKVKERLGDESVTIAKVKAAVLYVGQRLAYGVPKADADILEDETEACLWCWETRDVKLMPTFVRAAMRIRRTCRKRICERINAVSGMITALQKSESDQTYEKCLTNAMEKLVKVSSEAQIRSLVDCKLQKSGAEISEKEAKQEEKLRVKRLEKVTREAEKEKKRVERELRKEKLQGEKKLKQLHEAENDETHQEKDVSEAKKQLRKQEDAEKSQRRHEKEEAELKRKLAIQKQASMMERFFKRCKTTLQGQNDHPSIKANLPDSLSKDRESICKAMDHALSSTDEISTDDIRKLHVSSWHILGHSIRSNKKQHWGMRQKPRTKLYELKLTTNRLSCDYGLSLEKLENGWGEQTPDDGSCLTDIASSPDVRKYSKRKKLLQFDKSCRPAFYGVWPHKSCLVGARHPLRKEPDMDYDVDSDEEWEEEEPGESLSDCDKDDEDNLEEGLPKADDEDESEDGFFVPDGYLSENEGIQVDKMETESSVKEPRSLPTPMEDSKTLDFYALLQKQKHLNNLTEHALRKSLPLFILNLMHEKVPLLAAEGLCGTSKFERTCLQALTVRPFPTGPPVQISLDNMQAEEQDASPSNGKDGAVPVSTTDALPDSDMPMFVAAIHAWSQSINKVVESLQQKFPTVSKAQLRNKVREISEFTENRWQVKKDIMDKFGKSISPEKSGGKSKKSIAKFFSKRCMPPATDKSNSVHETCPQPSSQKAKAVGEEEI